LRWASTAESAGHRSYETRNERRVADDAPELLPTVSITLIDFWSAGKSSESMSIGTGNEHLLIPSNEIIFLK